MAGTSSIVSPIVIPVITEMPNIEESLQDVNKFNSSIEQLRTSLDTIRHNNQKSILPGFEEDIDRQISLTEKNIEQLTRLRDMANNVEGPEAQLQARRNYEQAYKRARTSAADLAESVKSSNSVTYDIAGEISSYISKAMQAEMPGMRRAIRGVAQNLAKSGNVGDEEILKVFEASPVYKNTLAKLQAGNSGVTPQMMKQISRSLLTTSVPQYLRNGFLEWDRGDYKAPQSARDRLPSSFGSISLSQRPAYRGFNSSAESLTQAEVQKLEHLIRSHPYMSQEFEKADIIRKLNGEMFINPNVNRSHISALGGLTTRLFEAGIRGGPHTGISDIEHPKTQKQLESILTKTNLSTSNSERLARDLQAAYDWFTPEHIQIAKASRGDVAGWRSIGTVNATPRETAAHFLELSLDNITPGGKIHYNDNERKEYLRTPYNLFHKELSRLGGADEFEHNGYNRNVIYVKMPIDELGNYETTPERKAQIKKQMASVFGSQIIGEDGYKYTFANLTPSHAAFVRDDLYRQELSKDRNFFWNGESRREFKNFEDFGRAIENAKKLHTQGEDIESLYGTDLSKANVVVTDLEKLRGQVLTGLNGQNFISRRLVPQSFQGRDFSGKSTFSTFDIDKLWEMYPQFVDAKSGDLVFPVGGINGGPLHIPKGTDILEDYSNIKSKYQYANMTQEQLNAVRSEEVRNRGILAKSTAEDFRTPARYISAQAAATMQLNPTVRDFFRREFMTRLDALNNVDQVKQLLFSGDDALSKLIQDDEGYLALPEAQNRISDYRKSLIANVGAGKLLVPQGKAQYGMISAWLPDIINNLVPQDQLTKEQKSWALGESSLEHNVAYFADLSDKLMLFRNPSTLSGNIKANNKAAGNVTYNGQEQTFQQFAKMLGVDPTALYTNPKSTILQLMQSADEDGDTAFVTALKTKDKNGVLKDNYNQDFANIMSYLVEDTVTRYKNMREISGRTKEQQDAVNKAHTIAARDSKDLYKLGETFEDVSDFVEGFAEQGGAMGFANAVSVNGSQWRPTQNVINGILDAEAHYDVDSNGRIKYNRKWVATDNEWDLLLGGAPLYQMYNWANKDLVEKRTKYDEIDEGPDYAAFAKRRVDAVNFPSRYDTHGITEAQQLYYTAHSRPDVELPYDWDEIFAHLPNEYENMPHVNKWLQRTRELKKGQLKGEFYGLDDSIATELSVLSANAFGELLRSGKEPKDIRTEALRLGLGDKFMGGQHHIPGIAENLKTSGLLRSFIEANPDMKEEAQVLANLSGAEAMYATATEIPAMAYLESNDAKEALKRQHNDNSRKIREAQQAKKEAQEVIASTEKEIAELSKEDKTSPKQNMINMLDQMLPNENGESWGKILKGKGMNSRKGIAAKVAEVLSHPFAGGESPTEAAQQAFASKYGLDLNNATEGQLVTAVVALLGDKGNKTASQAKASETKKAKLKEAQDRQAEAQKQIEQSDNEIQTLAKENEQIAVTQQKLEKSYEVAAKYDRVMAGAKEFSSELFKSFKGKEDKLNEISAAESYYNQRKAFANIHLRELDSFTEDEMKQLTDDEVKALKQQKSYISDNVDREFADRGLLAGKNAVEKLDVLLGKKSGTISKQGEAVQRVQDDIDFLTGYFNMYEKLAESSDVSNARKNEYKKASKSLQENINKMKQGKQQLSDIFTAENEAAAKIGIENLEIQAGLRKKNSLAVRSEARLRSVANQRKTIDNQYQEGYFSKEEYEAATAALDKLEAKSSKLGIVLQDTSKAAINGVTEPFKMLARNLEHQLFNKAIQEVKRFVTDYNKSMTEIQMITLKSNDQIATLGTNLIDKAKEMKISVSEITQSAATLYRQGLSDQEVDERLGVISKFSKVSGTKVDAATKLITVAMNTGLVSNAETAADIVTALGDSAATNAAEIEKGIEKAGAAAAADGTTFGQLAAMLTAITSTTQIGGNVAGRTLNTIIGRMNKIGTNELIYDENGNAISGSAVAKLLKAQGIDMYDENGNKRSSFDTLYALSQKWEGMSDAEQQQIANAIAGTRQYSNFAAIMSGMAEGDIDKYMALVGESSGITDKKFEIYTKSLEASLTNLKNTFDELIADMTDSGALTGFIDGIARAIQGVDNLTKSLGNTGAMLTTVLPLLAGIGMLKAGISTANPILALGGVAVAGIGYGIASANGGQNRVSDSERFNEAKTEYTDEYSEMNQKIERAKTLAKQKELSETESKELSSLMNEINLFNSLGTSLSDASSSAETLASSVDGLKSSAEEAAKALDAAKEKNDAKLAQDIVSNIGEQAKGIVADIGQGVAEYKETDRSAVEGLINVLWKKDETGKLNLIDDAEEIEENLLYLSTTNDGLKTISHLSNLLVEASGQAGFKMPEQYKNFNADDWNLALTQVHREQEIDNSVWSQLLKYLTYSETPSDSSANATKEAINKSFEDSFRGIVDDEMLSGISAYATESLLSLVTDENGVIGEITDELVRNVLNDIYGINLNDKESYKLANMQSSWTKAYRKFTGIKEPESTAEVKVGTEAEEGLDTLMRAVSVGYTAFEQANQEKLLADTVISAITNPNNKIKSLQDLVTYAKNGKLQSLNSLVTNQKSGALARIMNQAQISEEGIVGNTDPALMAAFIAELYGASSYGSQYVNTATKASAVGGILSRISPSARFLTPEETERAYQKDVEKYQKQYGKNAKFGYSQQEWARMAGIVSLDTLSDSYLSEILGADLAKRIKSPTERTNEDVALAKRIATNAQYGISGLTSLDKITGIREVAARLRGKGITGYSDYTANQYMQGFAGWDEYRKLKERQEKGETLNPEELKMLSAYSTAFDNFLKNSEVEFKIKGLDELEKAGSVIEGTSKAAEQLAKGGEFEIKARISIRSDLFNEAQLDAMLNSGNGSLIDQAVQQIMGVKGSQYYNNKEYYTNAANKQRSASIKERATSLLMQYGVAENQQAFIEDITAPGTGWKFEGGRFVYHPEEYVAENPYAGTEKQYTSLELAQMRKDIMSGKMTASDRGYQTALASGDEYWAEYQRLLYESGHTNEDYAAWKKSAEEAQKAKELIQKAYTAYGDLAGEHARQDYNRLKLGFTSAGEHGVDINDRVDFDSYWKDYEEDLETLAETEAEMNKIINAGPSKELRKAEERYNKASALQAEKDRDEQRLKDLYLESGTVRGMAAYIEEQYRQNNKGAIAADAIFGDLSTVKNAEDLVKVMGDPKNKDNWRDLINSSPELAKKLRDLGVMFDEDGINISSLSALTDASGELTGAFGSLLSAVQAVSDKYTHEDAKTVGERNAAALAYLNGDIYDEAAQYEALSQFLPSTAAQEIGSAYQSWLAAGGATKSEIDAWNADYNRLVNKYGAESYEADVFMQARPKPETFDWKKATNITDYDKKIIEDYQATAMYGGTGLGDMGIYNRLVEFRAAADQMNGLKNLRENTVFGDLFGEVSSTVPQFDTFAKGVQILNSAGIALKDFSTTSEACQDAFDKSGESIGEFAEAVQDVDTEIATRGVEVMKKYGKESENVAAMYKKLKGTAAEQLEAQKEMVKHQANLANSTYYTSGKGSKNYKDVAKNLLGYDKKEIAALEKSLGKDKAKMKIKQQAELQLEFDRQQVLNDANAEMQKTIDGLGDSFNKDTFLGTFTPEMEYDISELAAVAAEADAATRAVIDKLLESIGSAEGHVTFEASADGNSVVVKSKDIKTTGGGSRGGGGGGGGGGEKSATDILLDRQKYQQAEAQHKIKMIQLDQEHLDYMNHYDDWLGSLDSEVTAQQELYDVYKKNLDELKSHLGGLEKYSDEWYKVKDAIRAAEEGMKEVINAMDEINRKRVEVFTQKQEQEDKPGQQKIRLWDAKAESYQIRDQIESYLVSREQRRKQVEEELAQDQKQIEEWEEELKNHYEGSDTFNEIVDNIWEIQASIEEKKNELLSDTLEDQRMLIEQWQTDLENRIFSREHEVNQLNSWGDLYKTNRQDDYYRNVLQQRVDIMKEESAITDETLTKLREQIETLDEGTPAWIAAKEAIFSAEEAQLQYTIAMDEANHAIEQSKIEELARGYEEASKAISHQENLLKTQRDRYDKNNNFTMYQAVNEEMIELSAEKLAELRKQLQGWIDMQGEVTEGTDEWDSYIEKIRQTEEEIENEINNEEELIRLRNQSKFEHDQELFNRQNTLDEHQLKMIQYEESMYQNRGELTNQSKMIDYENAKREDMIARLKDYIVVLKEDLSLTEEGSEEYYKIAEAIYKAEEQLKNHTNSIEKNAEMQKKLQESILKTHQTLINTIDAEVKTRVKEQREMLSAEVSIQNQVLNIIRNRYKEEFKLVKDDIANKKKALQEEKALINERLQARLNAEDEEDKHTQLSELKRQLSLISSDPTRTKDMKNLQKQIDDMEKDLARSRAQDEAKAAQERLDEEMKAYDQYVAYQEEKLNEMLKDANSTALMEELSAVMGTDDMSREDRIQRYMNWIKQNDNNYKYGTEAMRLQMEQQNTDSWNKMLGWIDTYWDQVHDIIDGGIDRILDYMMESRSYQFAENEAQQKLQELNWKNQYEAYEDAYRDNAEYYHEDNEIVTQIEDEVFDINKGVTDLNGQLKDLYELYEAQIRYDYIRPTDVDENADKIDFKDYAGWGKQEVKMAGKTYSYVATPSEKKSGSKQTYTVYFTDSQGTEYSLNDENGMERRFNSIKEAQKAMEEYVAKKNKEYTTYSGSIYKSGDYDESKKVKGTDFSKSTKRKEQESKAAEEREKKRMEEWARQMGYGSYAEGGYVDYTGLAMVHGTPFRKESFLDAEDTENVRAMLDGFKYIKTVSMISPSDKLFGGNTSVGDINIIINEAQLKSDADLDALATEIGRKFTKQMSKEGLNLAGYSW